MWIPKRAVPAGVALTGVVCLGVSSQLAASEAAGAGQAQAAQSAHAVSAAAQSAVWAPKELRFVYQGFTSRYSCDGLRDKVRDALLRLGARKEDLKVIESPCAASLGRPTPFPGVTIRMSVLVPAGTRAQNAVPAHWKTVQLGDRDSMNASGDCELMEQIKQKIVPLFTTRNVELTNANCVPHQLQPVGPRLTADVLIADRQDTEAGPKS